MHADGQFCSEFTRKHVSSAFFSAELASELEDLGLKRFTFLRSDSDADSVMKEIELNRVGST